MDLSLLTKPNVPTPDPSPAQPPAPQIPPLVTLPHPHASVEADTVSYAADGIVTTSVTYMPPGFISVGIFSDGWSGLLLGFSHQFALS